MPIWASSEITADSRSIAAEACAMLADNGFETNYPPMPWDSDSPENAPV
jgi:hypothetical protein